jgi:hypothetical protein
VSSGELFSCSEPGSFSEKMEKISNPSLCWGGLSKSPGTGPDKINCSSPVLLHSKPLQRKQCPSMPSTLQCTESKHHKYLLGWISIISNRKKRHTKVNARTAASWLRCSFLKGWVWTEPQKSWPHTQAPVALGEVLGDSWWHNLFLDPHSGTTDWSTGQLLSNTRLKKSPNDFIQSKQPKKGKQLHRRQE